MRDEISIDIDLDNDDEQKRNNGAINLKDSIKNKRLISRMISRNKDKNTKETAHEIKFESYWRENRWYAYDENDNRIYTVKRALVAMRPCLKIYDYTEKRLLAEIKLRINPIPHINDDFIWIVDNETVGQVGTRRRLNKTEYLAEFLGWKFTSGIAYNSEMVCGDTVVAKPMSSRIKNVQSYEFNNPYDELYILMMFYTQFLDTNRERKKYPGVL